MDGWCVNNAWGGEEGGPGMVNPEGDGYLPLTPPPSQWPPPILMASSLVTLSPEASPLTASPTGPIPAPRASQECLGKPLTYRKGQHHSCRCSKGFRAQSACEAPGDGVYYVAESRGQNSGGTWQGWQSLASRAWEMFPPGWAVTPATPECTCENHLDRAGSRPCWSLTHVRVSPSLSQTQIQMWRVTLPPHVIQRLPHKQLEKAADVEHRSPSAGLCCFFKLWIVATYILTFNKIFFLPRNSLR